jgi:hypothetical protein
MKVILGELEEYSLEEYLKYRTLRNVRVYVDGVYMKDCFGFDTDKGEAYIHVTDSKGGILVGATSKDGSGVRKAIIHGKVTVEVDDESTPAKYNEEMSYTVRQFQKEQVTPFQINIKIVQTFEGEVTEHDLKEAEDSIQIAIEKMARMLEKKGISA